MKLSTALVILSSAFLLALVSAQQCGRQVGGALCANHMCCSSFGFCGTTEPWCGGGCQSQCWSQERADHRCGSSVGNPPCGRNRCCSVHGWCGGGTSYCGSGNCQYRCWYAARSTTAHPFVLLSQNLTDNAVSTVLSESLFDEMFKHRKDCPSQDFYTYDAFIAAAESFPGFGTAGDVTTRKREIAAFLGQISQATTGTWSDKVDPHAWGLCHINTTTSSSEGDYCTSPNWPCASGKKYSNRGAIQLSHNYNYGLAGEALGVDLINNPELVATDPVVSFKTAIWFWMTRHDDKPSCHEILTNANSDATRGSSYGHVIGNIINGAFGHPSGFRTSSVTTSIGYYKRYCQLLGVSHGHELNFWYDNFARIQMPVI